MLEHKNGYQPIPSHIKTPAPPRGGSAVVRSKQSDYCEGYRDGYNDAMKEQNKSAKPTFHAPRKVSGWAP
jgi:hypothetical protein